MIYAQSERLTLRNKKNTDMQAPCKNIEQGCFELNWIYMGHLGAYMGHKKASDKQQNRDQEFLEKIQLSEKT